VIDEAILRCAREVHEQPFVGLSFGFDAMLAVSER
jgi:hypothetical protein